MADNNEINIPKIEPSQKKSRKNLIFALLILFAVIVVYVFFRYDEVKAFGDKVWTILTPILLGIGIAYMLNPVMVFFERVYEQIAKKFFHVSGDKYKNRANTVSIVITITLFIGVVYVLIWAMAPELYQTFVSFIEYIPENFDKIGKWFDSINFEEIPWLTEVGIDVDTVLQNAEKWLVDNLGMLADNVLKYLTTGVKSVVSFLADVVIGICVAIYLMKEKNTIFAHMKKIVTASFKSETSKLVLDTATHAKEIFNGYIYGNIVGCLIVFAATFIFMIICGMPYAILISTLVCITNFIPFFGPFIGAVPSILILLLYDPMMALTFSIFTIILQQVEGHFLTPLIISDTTGVSPFWVTAVLLIGAGFFGLMGLILSVPVFSVIYYIVKLVVEKRLANRNLPTDTDNYVKDTDFDKDWKIKKVKQKKKKSL